jgi:two-component system nitrate/nitrite response regulator NarL
VTREAGSPPREVSRLLLVDDHASFLEPLAFMFEREPDFAVVGEAGTLAEARGLLRELAGSGEAVDVAVVDMNLPDGEGAELVGDLRTLRPNCAVLILSAMANPENLARAVEAGSSGLMHKSVRLKEVIDAARRLAAGEHLLSPGEIADMLRIAHQQREEDREAQILLDRLTRREKEVLQALAGGLNDPEIATRLYVSPGTVRTHIANALTKLEATSRLQAVVFAASHGAVEIGALPPPPDSSKAH